MLSRKRKIAFGAAILLLSGMLLALNAYNHPIEPLPEDAGDTASVPILMYHNLTQDITYNPWNVSIEMFARQMRALRDNGFTAVSLQCLVDYVYYGAPLPEKPVVITFDDGYLSVYEYAFPILKRYGHVATAFIIGHAVGTVYYKDTAHPTIPKFCYEQARRMANTVAIQSHSYDMHQWAPFEVGRARENILRWPDENTHDYIAVLRNDHTLIRDAIYAELGHEVFAVAFPHGIWDSLSQAVLRSMGVRVTLTTSEGGNTIIMGQPESLLGLNRFNIDDDVDEARLLEIILQ